MSYKLFFGLSAGISKPLRVPKGTLSEILDHVEFVETALQLKTEKYLDNPPHWTSKSKDFEGLDDKLVCRTVSEHNDWVRRIYDLFAKCSNEPVRGGEKITPKDAENFWHALTMLYVAPERWTDGYYIDRMDCIYEVMRGRPSEGITFDAKALTPKQADAVITLFSEFLDTHDVRLAVPNGCDRLASSADGGYVWCEKCGAVDDSDYGTCRKRKCPLREENPEDFE